MVRPARLELVTASQTDALRSTQPGAEAAGFWQVLFPMHACLAAYSDVTVLHQRELLELGGVLPCKSIINLASFTQAVTISEPSYICLILNIISH